MLTLEKRHLRKIVHSGAAGRAAGFPAIVTKVLQAALEDKRASSETREPGTKSLPQ